MKTNRSCWNCINSINHRTRAIAQTYWEPGEPAMVEDCDAPLPDTAWENWDSEFNQNSSVAHDLEDYIGSKCKFYIPEIYTCPICKSEVPADQSFVSDGIYEESFTCSEDCDSKMSELIHQEHEEMYS